ncbi:FAD-dependent oxidoreductase [Actinoplanes sp. URMC 104]|uniref:FAD-dependent oxidoreductase n=1 Tax=Actinoplanes sp. URMC 104 TaxID=3423409 RepID=UPI003F1B4EB1
MNASQYVVIGAGLAGAATAWSLARRGHEVTVLERTRPAAHDGSSHGSARIFRYAYPDAFYTQLVIRARGGFDELERLSGNRLITATGSLDFGTIRDPKTLAAVLESAGVEHELLSAAEARARWPQIGVDTDVLWHPGAGVIDAETTVTTMLDAARHHGAQFFSPWPVSRVEATANGYRLNSGDGRTIDAERIVVASGGWLPALLDQLPLPAAFRATVPALQVSQEYAYHFPYRDEPASGPVWPTFIHKSEAIQTYSLPGGRDADYRGQKLAEYNGGRRIPSALDQDGVIDPANRQRIVEYVQHYLPGLVPEPYAETTCLFTNTANENFLVDGIDGITLLSPCSGHGAKFAPVIGDIAADAATGAAPVPERFTASAIGAAAHV